MWACPRKITEATHSHPTQIKNFASLMFTTQAASLTPGYTVTDVFPPKFTVRPSFLIRRFKPRAPGSPPTGGGNKELRVKGGRGKRWDPEVAATGAKETGKGWGVTHRRGHKAGRPGAQ